MVSRNTIDRVRNKRDHQTVSGMMPSAESLIPILESDVVQVPLQFGTDLMTNLVSAPAREFRDFSRFGQAVRALDPGYEVPESAMTEQEIGRREAERRAEEALLSRKPDASGAERMRVRAQAVRDYHDVGWVEEMGLGIIPEIPLIAATGGLAAGGGILAKSAATAGAKTTAKLAAKGVTPKVATGVGKAISGTGQAAGGVLKGPEKIDVAMSLPFKGAGIAARKTAQVTGADVPIGRFASNFQPTSQCQKESRRFLVPEPRCVDSIV